MPACKHNCLLKIKSVRDFSGQPLPITILIFISIQHVHPYPELRAPDQFILYNKAESSVCFHAVSYALSCLRCHNFPRQPVPLLS